METNGLTNKRRRGAQPGNPGGGRRPDWLKEYCRKIVSEKKLVERFGHIAAGGHVEQMLSDGRIVTGPAPIGAQEKAFEGLLDRGWGKAPQEIVPGEGTAGRFVFIAGEVKK